MFVFGSAGVWIFKLWGNLGKDLNIQTESPQGLPRGWIIYHRLRLAGSGVAKISLGKGMMNVVKEGVWRWTFPCSCWERGHTGTENAAAEGSPVLTRGCHRGAAR